MDVLLLDRTACWGHLDRLLTVHNGSIGRVGTRTLLGPRVVLPRVLLSCIVYADSAFF